MIVFNSTAIARFWSKVNKEGPIPEHRPELGPCWVWKGQIGNRGYGTIKTASYAEVRSHQASWEIAYGPLPNGLWILHRCDNPACVRPEHLRAGTQDDNARDMAAKFRTSTTKLTVNAVEEIRATVNGHSSYGRTKELAEKYGVHRSSIRRTAKAFAFKDVGTLADEEFIAGSGLIRPVAMDGSQIDTVPLRTFADLSGETFERLTVVSFHSLNEHGETRWNCTCSCGESSVVMGSHLKRGSVKSCGCLARETRLLRQGTLEERFWKRVDVRALDECWPWIGKQFERAGHGRMKHNGRKVGAHRISWQIANPDEPLLTSDDFICHSCDNPPCCNPAHLTRADATFNVADMIRKGRKVVACKYTDQVIRRVRALRANGFRYKEIAESTGLSVCHVSNICLNKTRLSV